MPDDMQTGGQAPAGEQPQAGNAAQSQQQQQSQLQAGNGSAQPSSNTTSQAGAEQNSNSSSGGSNANARETLSADELREALRKAREEAAAHRVKLREYEDAQKAAELAKLDETERLRRQLADEQSQRAAATVQAQERIVRAEVRAAAGEAGIKPALAARLIDFAAIDYDSETGEPTNIATLLKALVDEYPELRATAAASTATTQTQQPAQRASAGIIAAPARSSTQTAGGLTRELIEHMTPREYAQRRSEVMAWLAAHPNG